MRLLPQPPAAPWRSVEDLTARLDALRVKAAVAGKCEISDILDETIRRLRAAQLAEQVLARIWTQGLEPAGWIAPGPFRVRHSEIAQVLIPLGHTDPYPADLHPPTSVTGGGRGGGRGGRRKTRLGGRVAKGKISSRWGQT